MRRLIALVAVIVIPAGMMIWYRVHTSSAFASIELIVYPLLFGGIGIAGVLLLMRYFLNVPLSAFNASTGGLGTDVLWGIALAGIYFVLFFVERATLSELLRFESNEELLTLMLGMRENPLLLLIWFGPVLWVGIGLFEELVRAFLLIELWSFSNRMVWKVTSIVLAAAVVGLVHWSQGPYGILTIAIKSVVAGTFYFHRRRLMPLVVGHVLYDGLQVGMLLMTYPFD